MFQRDHLVCFLNLFTQHSMIWTLFEYSCCFVSFFIDSMKKRTKEFIKAMNTQAYSQRLKDMIECEKVCYFFLLLFDKYIQKYVFKNNKFLYGWIAEGFRIPLLQLQTL